MSYKVIDEDGKIEISINTKRKLRMYKDKNNFKSYNEAIISLLNRE